VTVRSAAVWTESIGTIRRYVRVPVGANASVPADEPPGSVVVRPTYVLAGLTCGIPAWLRIGIDTSLASSSNSPM